MRYLIVAAILITAFGCRASGDQSSATNSDETSTLNEEVDISNPPQWLGRAVSGIEDLPPCPVGWVELADFGHYFQAECAVEDLPVSIFARNDKISVVVAQRVGSDIIKAIRSCSVPEQPSAQPGTELFACTNFVAVVGESDQGGIVYYAASVEEINAMGEAFQDALKFGQRYERGEFAYIAHDAVAVGQLGTQDAPLVPEDEHRFVVLIATIENHSADLLPDAATHFRLTDYQDREFRALDIGPNKPPALSPGEAMKRQISFEVPATSLERAMKLIISPSAQGPPLKYHFMVHEPELDQSDQSSD